MPTIPNLVRTTRSEIICLRNDYKALLSKIEIGLHAHHAAVQSASTLPTQSSSQGEDVGTSSNITYPGLVETPFAKVNGVVTGSPAEDAGLRVGDRIRRFGDVNWINHDKLSKVAETVQRNEGVSSLFSI